MYYSLQKQKKQAIESLQKANQELDRFVYSAAHDLRAPVASLLGLLNLSKDETDIGKIREYWNLKEKTVKKMFIKSTQFKVMLQYKWPI